MCLQVFLHVNNIGTTIITYVCVDLPELFTSIHQFSTPTNIFSTPLKVIYVYS